jgi:hypothetical protein
MGLAWRICRSSKPRPVDIAWREISSAPLPLNEPDRGRPVVGAVDKECEEDEGENRLDADEEGGTVDVAIAARYWITFLVFSVLPAPDSPLDG